MKNFLIIIGVLIGLGAVAYFVAKKMQNKQKSDSEAINKESFENKVKEEWNNYKQQCTSASTYQVTLVNDSLFNSNTIQYIITECQINFFQQKFMNTETSTEKLLKEMVKNDRKDQVRLLDLNISGATHGGGYNWRSYIQNT